MLGSNAPGNEAVERHARRQARDGPVVAGEVEVGVLERELGAVLDGGELAVPVADRRDPAVE